MENVDEAIRDGLPGRGFIRFSIKANDTKENQAIHNAFKEFCSVETDSNYTQGLKTLLENIQTDYKYELLSEELALLKAELAEIKAGLQEKKSPKKKKDGDVF